MNRRLSSLCALVGASLIGHPALAAEDIQVCVQVELHAPAAKSKGNGKAVKPTVDTPQAASAAVTQASPAPGFTENVPAPPVEGAPASQPGAMDPMAALTEPLPPPKRANEPRVMVVDHSLEAEEAANVASEVDPQGTRDPRVQSGAHLPVGQTPTLYLKRLMEHFVTHEPGYIASQGQCAQTIVVELYPLKAGWTVFARYSGTGREERIDQLLPTELSQFAERSVLALLHDVPIGETVDRDNVLWADSLKSTQRIRGRNHVVLGVGTRARAGLFDTVIQDSGNPRNGATERKLRLLTPMSLTLGYRGQFDQYGVEALGELALGTETRSANGNPSGGHIDYGGSTGVVLHVLRYLNPRGVTSAYWGAGANFGLHWFRAIKAQENRARDARSTLLGGGLDVDLVGGYEFMRASTVSFYLQGELNLPAYVVRNENNDGRINTWFPGAALRLGASF